MSRDSYQVQRLTPDPGTSRQVQGPSKVVASPFSLLPAFMFSDLISDSALLSKVDSVWRPPLVDFPSFVIKLETLPLVWMTGHPSGIVWAASLLLIAFIEVDFPMNLFLNCYSILFIWWIWCFESHLIVYPYILGCTIWVSFFNDWGRSSWFCIQNFILTFSAGFSTWLTMIGWFLIGEIIASVFQNLESCNWPGYCRGIGIWD